MSRNSRARGVLVTRVASEGVLIVAKASGEVDQATHGGGKRDKEGQASSQNRLTDARHKTPGPVRKRPAKKTVPKKPFAGDRG